MLETKAKDQQHSGRVFSRKKEKEKGLRSKHSQFFCKIQAFSKKRPLKIFRTVSGVLQDKKQWVMALSHFRQIKK